MPDSTALSPALEFGVLFLEQRHRRHDGCVLGFLFIHGGDFRFVMDIAQQLQAPGGIPGSFQKQPVRP